MRNKMKHNIKNRKWIIIGALFVGIVSLLRNYLF